MQQYAIVLGKLLKERDNKSPADVTQAKVISPLPNIKISLGDEIILEEGNLVIANRIYSLDIKTGDSVILIPTANGQLYFIIDKVGE